MHDLEFWYEHLGRFLSDAPPALSTKPRLETRLKKGVAPNTLGAGIAAHYIVTPLHAWLIGKIESPNTERITYVPSDGENGVSGEKFIAEWLTAAVAPSPPFLIGVIGNASPNNSFRVSHSLARVFFCEAGKGMAFDLNVIRGAKAKIAGLSWWKTVSPALRQRAHLVAARCSHDEQRVALEIAKMQKMLDKAPELGSLIRGMEIRPDSGEFQLLNWVYRDTQ